MLVLKLRIRPPIRSQSISSQRVRSSLREPAGNRSIPRRISPTVIVLIYRLASYSRSHVSTRASGLGFMSSAKTFVSTRKLTRKLPACRPFRAQEYRRETDKLADARPILDSQDGTRVAKRWCPRLRSRLRNLLQGSSATADEQRAARRPGLFGKEPWSCRKILPAS